MQVTSIEDLKSYLKNSSFKYISFDVFDTLILRPFFKPTNLFLLNAIDCNTKRKKLFVKIRIYSEKLARILVNKEDINIDDIYKYVKIFYGKKRADIFKKNEIRLELSYTYSRDSVKQLFNFLSSLDKKIICISDMYLEKSIINEILNKNGYSNIHKIYVSNTIGYTKYTGNLYKYVLRDLNIKSYELCHIGDNYESDILSARKLGIRAILLDKTMDLALKNNEDINNIDNIFEIIKKSEEINKKYDDPYVNS